MTDSPNSSPFPQTNLAARITAPGRSALATIALIGPDALRLIETHFRPYRPPSLTQRTHDKPIYGHWVPAGSPVGESPPAAAEDLVVRVVAAWHVEVHCHGGRAAPRRILDDLVACGVTEVEPEQLSSWLDAQERDASLAGDALDRLARHEAWRLLPSAPTERTALLLLEQWQGAWQRARTRWRRLAAQSEFLALRRQLERFLDLAPVGKLLTRAARVCLIGPPNVGKSSLVNALVGYERSIVLDQPGTTRDLVTATIALDGWPIELTDTAGLHEAPDPLEQAAIRLAVERLGEADLLLLVEDAQRPGPAKSELAGRVEHMIARSVSWLQIINKIDLPGRNIGGSKRRCLVSARTGEGLAELSRAIVATLVPELPGPGDPIPIAEAHLQWAHARLQQLQVEGTLRLPV